MKYPIILIAIILAITFSCQAQKAIKVACVGNSITYGATIENREKYAYPAQLQKLLGEDYSVGNFGKSGATLLNKGHNPYTKNGEYKKALEFAGDIVVIHLGINDTDPRNWPNYKDDFVKDYLDLIDSFKEANSNARIIIARMTPINSGHPRFNSGTKEWHTQIQKSIETVAKVANVQFIDFHERLYSKFHLLPDNIHPNKEGASILAETVFQAITGNYGGLKLPMLYTDNMILQRHIPLKITGTANAHDKVTVSFNKQKKSTVTADNGKWSITFAPMDAGGPYELSVKTKEKSIDLTNILVGEVWLCSGQSNMEWRVKQSRLSSPKNAAKEDVQLRLFDMKGQATGHSAYDSITLEKVYSLKYFEPTQWNEASIATINEFSAIAYHFGQMLRDSLKIPIGLICNAVGGSNTESWIDKNTLENEFPLILHNWQNNDFIQDFCRSRGGKQMEKSTHTIKRHAFEPAYLNFAGIQPLESFPIKGVIWYQGESNTHNIEAHEELFQLLVKSWRENWSNEQLPFYYVQLSSLNRPSWGWFRNSQRELMSRIPHTGMAVSSDKGDPADVHPKIKDVIGQRLAHWALAKQYNCDITPSGPLFKNIEQTKDGVYINFEYGEGLLTNDGKAPSTFEVAKIDGLFYPAKATIEGNQIKLSCDKVKEIRYVRYGWAPFTRANLINKDGLPASTFRSDIE